MAPHAEDAVKVPKRPKLSEVMGPGLITGASDDDPSGIATYSQAGAQFGYDLGWVLLFTYPLMCAIQQISAWIGRVTGRGLAGNMRQHMPHWLLFGLVGMLVVANVLNIGADLGAMAAALKLLIGGLAGAAAPFLASAEGTLARDAASKDAASKDAASAVGEKAAGGPDVSKNNLSGVSGVLVDAGGVKTVLNSGVGQNQTGLDIDPNRFNADGTPKDPLATGGLA